MDKITVILGTAHSESTPGKRSPDGKFREYKYSREICKLVSEELKKKGINCIVDMPENEEISLNHRCKLVNKLVRENGGAKNCIYVSIHNNAAGSGDWKSARGFSVYCYTKGSENSRKLAKIFHDNAMEMKLPTNRSYPKTGYYTANFAVLRLTSCPAVLTENMFLDNKEDVAFLTSEEGKLKIVDLHVNSILEYLK